MAVVPQRTEILAGTLAENIALFDPDLLARAAGALDELGLAAGWPSCPTACETRLGDGGYVLSAGQEQLVAFARILVRDPHVVILDEATARMDPVTEARVQRATERLLRGRIGIVIAHRLSSVRRCDEVVVLADGRGRRGRAAARRRERFAAAARAHSSGGRRRRRGGRLRRRRGRGSLGSRTDPDVGSRRGSTPVVRAGRRSAEGRPAAAAAAAAGADAAADLPARHQRPALRAGRGRRSSS